MSHQSHKIQFNTKVKLVLTDVDETIADVYKPAEPEMTAELSKLLHEGKTLFLISGGGLPSIRERIVDFITPNLRRQIIIAHCSGAEVWGFDKKGDLHKEPFYGIYEGKFSNTQKKLWRKIIKEVLDRFHLKTFPTQPRDEFIKNSKADPLSIMLADRGPQIAFECTNSIDLSQKQVHAIERELNISIPSHHGSYDLRIPMMQEAERLYKKHKLPIHPQFGGIFSLDHVIDGVDKTKAIHAVLMNKDVLSHFGLKREDINDAEEIEIWGDKFGQKKGGADFLMCLAMSPNVRAIDFRHESEDDIPQGFNIQIWNGAKTLHHGLLEYLQSRDNANSKR
jgi:hydroxymethylpyrimidine pyrophosphatase-like HAD family hydrolase